MRARQHHSPDRARSPAKSARSVRDRVPLMNRPAPRHPARPATESTAGLLARGSPPVTAFPGFLLPVAVWHRLAAYSCGGSCGIGTWVPHRIPYSLSLRETVDGTELRVRGRTLSMRYRPRPAKAKPQYAGGSTKMT